MLKPSKHAACAGLALGLLVLCTAGCSAGRRTPPTTIVTHEQIDEEGNRRDVVTAGREEVEQGPGPERTVIRVIAAPFVFLAGIYQFFF